MLRILLISLSFVAFAAHATEPEVDCSDAISTPDINYCAGLELNKAQNELEQYLNKVFELNNDDPETVHAITNAQEQWKKYYDAHCSAIYTYWRGGTIRGVMALGCKTRLTKLRTHELWLNFLTHMDSSAPELPEPVVE